MRDKRIPTMNKVAIKRGTLWSLREGDPCAKLVNIKIKRKTTSNKINRRKKRKESTTVAPFSTRK